MASKRFLVAASDLEGGKPNSKVMSDVIVYSLFLVDQLECEEVEALNILKKLRNNVL